MMNNVMLVGRLTQEPELKKIGEEKNVVKITLAVNRTFKNAEGVYETDFIDCVLWDGIATNLKEYCHKGDVVGVRGRLQVSNIEKEDGSKYKITEVVAEKLTFLSSKRDNDSDEK